tara:strand:- start:5117 stop:7936 length:2820 start_codon:yes stop_codon:yes gene_type:complete
MSKLIDMTKDIKSFNYSSVGKQHLGGKGGKDYFGDDHATGFTPNRNEGMKSEFKGVTQDTYMNSGIKWTVDGVKFPGPVNRFDDTHQSGYTIGRTTEGLPSEFIGVTPPTFTQTGTKYSMGGITFPGPVDYFDHQSPLVKGLEYNIQSERLTMSGVSWPGPVDYFKHYDSPLVTDDLHYNNFSENLAMSGVSWNGPVNYFSDDHASGFTLNQPLKSTKFKGFGGSDEVGVQWNNVAGTGWTISGFNFQNQSNLGNSYNISPIALQAQKNGFTANRQEKQHTEFFGFVTDGSFVNVGSKWTQGGFNFNNQRALGNNFSILSDIYQSGFTSFREELMDSQFVGVDDDGNTYQNPGQLGSNDFKVGTQDYFDQNHQWTAGAFVADIGLKETGFLDDKWPSNLQYGEGTVNYITGIDNAISGVSTEGQQANAVASKIITQNPNRAKTSDFGENHQYGAFQPQLEFRVRDLSEVHKGPFGGGNADLRRTEPSSPWQNSDHPLIIKDLGVGYNNFGTIDDGIVRGGIALNVERAIDDVERIGKWLLTPKGLLWTAKQFLLQHGAGIPGLYGNARIETKVYNPLGTLGSVAKLAGVGVHLPRHADGLTGLNPNTPGQYEDYEPDSGYAEHFEDTPIKNSQINAPYMRNRPDNEQEAFEPPGGLNLTAAVGSLFGSEPKRNTQKADTFNLGKGFIRTEQGKLYAVGASNQLQVPYGGKFGKMLKGPDGKSDLPKDFIKFRIRDAVNGKNIIFPAQLGTITDTVTPEYTKERYIGRPDSVHIYSGTERSVAFDFKVAAFTKQEIPIIQEKMNYLMGLGYPTYKQVISGDKEFRPTTPFIYLTIGDLFNATPGYFDNITITIDETGTWEIDEGFQIPQFFSVSVNFVHVGKYLPHTLGKHYEVPWLKDGGLSDKSWGTFNTDPYKKGTQPNRVNTGTTGDVGWSKGIGK